MAVDKLVDSAKLNAALNYEANKIIAKGGGTAPLAFDFENEKGFGDYVDAIPSGGATEVTISGSGAVAQALDPDKIYHFTGDLTALTITLTGTVSNSQYQFDFISGGTLPTLAIPTDVNIPVNFEIMARGKTTIIVSYGNLVSSFDPLLPSGYTRIKCVSIPSGGYVDTGIIPLNHTNTFYVDARVDTPISSITSGSATIFGARQGPEAYAQLGVFAAYSGFIFQFSNGVSYSTVSTKDNNRHLFYCSPFAIEMAVDQTKAKNTGKIDNVSPNANVLIAARQNQSNNGFERFTAETIWSYRHIVDLVCAINLIPCKRDSDSAYGFFDTVSGNFFGNSGTGTFTEGVE